MQATLIFWQGDVRGDHLSLVFSKFWMLLGCRVALIMHIELGLLGKHLNVYVRELLIDKRISFSF